MKLLPMKMTVKDAQGGQTITTYNPCEPKDATHVMYSTPSQEGMILPVNGHKFENGAGWQWNGDTEHPTLKPSVRTSWKTAHGVLLVDHYWVRDGKVQYCSDSTHGHKGTHLLLDIPEEEQYAR